jgi:hypothetical protein
VEEKHSINYKLFDDLHWIMSRSIVITGLRLAAGLPQHAFHEALDVDPFTGQYAGQ